MYPKKKKKTHNTHTHKLRTLTLSEGLQFPNETRDEQECGKKYQY